MDEKAPNTCMFCLETQPKTIIYDGPCDCKPHTHINCLKDWFEHVPNECPICRMDYDPPEEIIINSNLNTHSNANNANNTNNTNNTNTMGINRNLLASYNYNFNCLLAFFLIAYLAIVFELQHPD